MKAAVKIAKWVQKKPLVLIHFKEDISKRLRESKQGFEKFTIARPHAYFDAYKLPTPCILQIDEQESSRCYLATIMSKQTVSTFESRLTIKKSRSVGISSLSGLISEINDKRMRSCLTQKLPKEEFSLLTPTLSVLLIKILAKDSVNHSALETVFAQLPGLRKVSDVSWAQENAIHSALSFFGIRGVAVPHEISLKTGTTSALSDMRDECLYEDNVVRSDASSIPGFNSIASDVTGRAVFQKNDERLVIYTANRLPLEKMLGVDLIYINETRGNTVMIQYKMLQENKSTDSRDWLFRPDKQMRDEIKRMCIPPLTDLPNDYRLNRNPFFFKFVKRKIVKDSCKSFLLSLDHLNQILAMPDAKGPKGGVRLSYDTLNGTYLRETDMIGLIRSGYIGTHRKETEALRIIIDKVAKGNKAVVLAWQQKIKEYNND